MIEFKAECGHAVRARDEDAGGTVRCSYCGRNASVPIQGDRDLEYLFSAVEQAPQEDDKARRRRMRNERRTKKTPKGPTSFSPFSVILRLCYAAALIIVVVVMARKFVIPMFDDQTRARRFAGAPTNAPALGIAPSAPATTSSAPPTRPRMLGLIREGRAGLYVSSTPPGASMWGVDESKAPAGGRIHLIPGSLQGKTPADLSHVNDGTYVIEVAFAWNDPNLSDPGTSNHQNYTEFRRKIERATSEQRKQLMEEYFIPDEAVSAFVDQTADQIYLVRQYRGVVVRGGQGQQAVRALFLPRLAGANSRQFRLDSLTNGFIPIGKNYEFDERHVRAELSYYGVADADQTVVLDVLSRIGVAPYQTPDRRVRLFKIGITDGQITSPVIREASE